MAMVLMMMMIIATFSTINCQCVNTENCTIIHNELLPKTAQMMQQPQLGVCQLYTGTTCEHYLHNETVFVPPHITIDILEDRLKAAYGVIKESKDMNPNCRVYALPSLCYSILPICRTPEKTNHLFFANKAAAEHARKHAIAAAAAAIGNHAKRRVVNIDEHNKRRLTAASSTTTTTTTNDSLTTFYNDTTYDEDNRHKRQYINDINNEKFEYLSVAAFKQTEYPPTRSSENVRRICRNECELLENELCQKEYAIAKRHPTIGQKLPLEDCYDLPDDDDCSKMGIVIDADETEQCYWENGSGYRGTKSISVSGKTCLKWARLMKEIANYPELAGQNYCRYVG